VTRRTQLPLPFDGLLAPLGSLCLLLTLVGWTLGARGKDSHRYCTCGADLGPEVVPRLNGPDPLSRAPVLELKPGGARLDAAEVDGGPRSHGDSPDWRLPRLAELLELREPRGAINLFAPRDLPALGLRRYLYTLWLAGQREVLLVVRARGSERYSGARMALLVELPTSRLELKRPSRLELKRHEQAVWLREQNGSPILRLSRFATVEALAREVVGRRGAGETVYLSLAQ